VTLPGTVNDRPRPLNTKEAAAELRVHVYTVRNMLERGQIPGVKLAGRWYIRQQDLDALLAGEIR
jgi:excisionase family DNA binding protein